MDLLVFSLFDAKSSVFGQPYFAAKEEIAVRHFAAALRDPDSMLGKFPGDFTLFRIGTFNQETGLITGLQTGATQVVNGLVLAAQLEK